MKLTCTQENLKSALQTVGRIISSNNTLPILSNILIKTENGTAKISATNLEIAITTHMRCRVETEGEVTVLYKAFSDLINNLPNKNLLLQQKDNLMEVEVENYHTAIKTLSAEEFPLIPTVESREVVNINSQALKNAIDQVAPAASTNQTQPEISGVLFSFEKDVLKLVSTDRYRLAEKKLTLNNKLSFPSEIIIPQKTALELSRLIGQNKTEVDIALSETQASFNINSTKIVSRVIDGQYPDYKQIIPTEFPTVISTEKEALINALRAAAIFSQNTNSVRLEYSGSKQALTLTTESADLGKSVIDLAADVEGREGVIILNHRYILDCLLSVGSQSVLIKIINESSPALILPKEDSSYIYLIMPIKA